MFFFQAQMKKLKEKNHANVTVTVVRDGKIHTVLRTNQNVGFIKLPGSKKLIILLVYPHISYIILYK